MGFKRKLADQISQRTGERLSSSTLFATLNALRAFFHWLAGQPGYRSTCLCRCRLLRGSPRRRPGSRRQGLSPVPTIEQILHVVRTMPCVTEIDRRNRALVAFTLLTGARDGAIASLKLKHVDIAEGRLLQDAREVRTSSPKPYDLVLPRRRRNPQGCCRLGGVPENGKLFGPKDPLFPATQVAVGAANCFRANGLSRSGWSNATPRKL